MFLIDYETSCDLVRKGASERMSESKSRSIKFVGNRNCGRGDRKFLIS